MKKTGILSAIIVAVVVMYSCHKTKQDQIATSGYLDLPVQTDTYFTSGFMTAASRDTANRRATLGRVLFYDKHLSINNAVACASCHKQQLGFADNVAFSAGFEGRKTGRNSPGFSGLTGNGLFFWDGRERVLTNLILRPIANHVEMGLDDLDMLTEKLSGLGYYEQLFISAFGDKTITLDRISKSVAWFLQSVGVANGGRTMPPGTEPLPALATIGRSLFDTVYNCGSCHLSGNGYNGGGQFIDIGLDEIYADNGLGTITGRKEDQGLFKVPNLTNVMLTAPYMHDGRYATIDEVLDHYSHGIGQSPNLNIRLKDKNGNAMRMNITENDKKAIIAFLGTLTDHNTITDPKFSNPFKAK